MQGKDTYIVSTVNDNFPTFSSKSKMACLHVHKSQTILIVSSRSKEAYLHFYQEQRKHTYKYIKVKESRHTIV